MPTGLGPIINVQRGEARHSFLVGIAAHDDGDGVLRYGFQRQSGVLPPVLKGEKGGFQKFSHEVLLKANILDISGHFVGQRTRAVPVGYPLMQRAVLLREGFSSEEIRGPYQAWNSIDGVLRDEVVVAVAKASRAVTAVGAAARVEVTAAEEAAAAPVVPAVVATIAVADLMAAVGDATGGATSGRRAPRRRVASSTNLLGARVLATRRAHAHRTRRCWQWSYRCQKRISP